jgi:hypothetical protein
MLAERTPLNLISLPSVKFTAGEVTVWIATTVGPSRAIHNLVSSACYVRVVTVTDVATALFPDPMPLFCHFYIHCSAV